MELHPDTPLSPAILRRFHTASLVVEDLPTPARFVHDSRTGRLVLPISSATLAAEEIVLFIPEERDNALQLLVSATEIADWRSQEVCDRWQAYFSKPPHQHWASLEVLGAKLGARVMDTDDLLVPNLLAGLPEARLCKLANADRARLRALCLRAARLDVPDPLVVGIDQFGLDVRAALGILRIEFPAPLESAAQAPDALAGLLEGRF